MNFTGQTDVAMRILMYLTANPGQQFILGDIAKLFKSPRPQVAKAAQALRRAGYLASRKGRNGEIWLAQRAEDIRVNDVVRAVEPNFDLSECFSAHAATGGGCPLADGCALKSTFEAALNAFMDKLGEVTLAELVARSTAKQLRA